MHSCVLKIKFLSRPFDTPTLIEKKVFDSNMRTHKADKSRNLERVLKEKETSVKLRLRYCEKFRKLLEACN